MSLTRTSLSLLRGGVLLAGLALAAVSGCGGIGPGDYVIYRVAFSDPEPTTGCFANGQIPPDTKDDSTTFRDTGTLILYAGKEDVVYLDTGKGTLEGKKSDNGYSFSGKSVDVSYSGPNDDTKLTETTTVKIDLTIDGKTVSGKIDSSTSVRCTGNNCPMDLPSDCTQKSDFVGTEVDDVELKHDV